MDSKPRTNNKTILVGAGISTLSAALQLQRAGLDYEMFEKLSDAGGLCQTICDQGFTYDTVSHVLHIRSREAKALLAESLEQDCVHVERSSAVYFKGRYIPFPFQAHLGFLPGTDRFRALMGLLWATLIRNGKGGSPKNFAEWVQTYYGKAVSELFMGPYNEKLWGVVTSELSTDWVGSFVPKTSMTDVLRSFLGHRSQIGYNAKFSYPREGGIGSLIHKLAGSLRPIRYQLRLTALDLDRKEAQFSDGSTATYENLVTCIPLTQLAELTTDLPAEVLEPVQSLKSTSVLSLVYCLNHPLPHKHHWVYYHEPQYPFFRLFFPSNIHDGMAPNGCSIVAAEVSNPAKDRLETVERETLRQLREIGLVRDESSIAHRSQHYYEYGYPVHDLHREQVVRQVLDYYRSRNVWPVGRFGAWYYSSVDDAIAEGVQVGERLIKSQEAKSLSRP